MHVCSDYWERNRQFVIETVSGTTTWPEYWPTSVCFSPVVRRETPPAPHVTRLQYPAVIRWDQPLHQLLPLPQHLLLKPVQSDWLTLFHFQLTVQFRVVKWMYSRSFIVLQSSSVRELNFRHFDRWRKNRIISQLCRGVQSRHLLLRGRHARGQGLL